MTKPKPAPHAANATAKTVKAGQADSKRQARGHQAKVQANADRVADMNAERDQLSRTECVAYLQGHGLYTGMSRASLESLRATVDGHRRGMASGIPADPAAVPDVPPVPEATPDVPPASTDRLERQRLAKAEHAAHKAWRENGQVGPKPPSPNLDAINAKAPTAKPGSAKQPATTRRPAEPKAKPEIYVQALAAKKAGNRGKATKVTDVELDTQISQLRKNHPDLTREQALEVAYWVLKLALSRGRWNTAWERATAPVAKTG